ncbi:TetR/AcrR family transcriptional regulator [Streptomyces sp. CB01881]|uniref:TetR/AcrR family transcriptional regulator n=1 Tax=Streptomyces sp. CB01881 TaxID=2078691 RepID=UPI000CDC744D|nr:TetR/AcrR family transcriptional regulator [Streptomyces sp. CB01881]AUY50270.1 TetR/AcrR family transcriptional regulator [Streptomyces sp. CB01881]TYC73658.1 TetR/AcrR family transcriptional regulator [Streptomyces sp. CB01881]
MSPRSYRMGQRQADVDETRARIVAAARGQLAGTGTLSLDAVAKRADVARATVYYQFGSKTGLLEAVCDALAAEGGMARLAEAFTLPGPWPAVDRFVEVMGGFWAVDRVCTRRLRALAALDEEVGRVIAARDARRREGARVLAARLDGAPQDAAALLFVLTGFETFDALAGETAGPDGDLRTAVPAVTRLVRSALGGPAA